MKFDHLARPSALTGTPRERWESVWAAQADPVAALVDAAHQATTIDSLFYAGYQAALALEVGITRPAALLVTEPSGQHPRSLSARFDGTLSGTKAMALDAVDDLLVVARANPPGEPHAELVLVRVHANHPSIQRQSVSQTLLPDVPHSRVTFDRTPVDAVVCSDAWSNVVRPFRAREECCLGLAFATSQVHHDPRWLAQLALFEHLVRGDPSSTRELMIAGGVAATIARIDAGEANELGVGWKRFVAMFEKVRKTRAERATTAWKGQHRD